MELLIRASRNDHTIVEHFLTPASSGMFASRTQPIDIVVADATVAAERPQLARLTSDAGVPYAIDPLTPLLQTEQPPTDRWTQLPFAHAERLRPQELNAYLMDELIDLVITEQREQGATYIIPPYFYSNKRGDAWSQANLNIIKRTAGYLSSNGVSLPVVPVFAASLTEFAPLTAWSEGIQPFLDATREMNTYRVALSWSWNAQPKSGDAALSLLLGATQRASEQAEVIGWRAGLFGHAMTAVGARGYETGIGARESLHYVALQSDHKPKAPKPLDDGGPRTPAFIYFSPLGRSVLRRAAVPLLADRRINGSLVCAPENGCCANGADTMTESWREHTVRERARELRELEGMPPSTSWRLNHVATKARRAESIARSANEVLVERDINVRIPAESFESLHRVASEMLETRNRRVA